MAQVAVSETKAGKTPLCLLPNPYYNVYSGGGVMAGAEPYYLEEHFSS